MSVMDHNQPGSQPVAREGASPILAYTNAPDVRVTGPNFWEKPVGLPMLIATVALSILILVELREGRGVPWFYAWVDLAWAALAVVAMAWIVRSVARLWIYLEGGPDDPENARIGWITLLIPLIITSTALAAYWQLPMRLWLWYCLGQNR
jgi:hypothetical protein